MTIHLSRLAQKDLDDIRQYTVERWGRDQWLTYFRGLARTFERISENPERGRPRDLFYPGMRSLSYESHLVFYKRIMANGNAPVILRIVHQKRNMPALIYYDELEG